MTSMNQNQLTYQEEKAIMKYLMDLYCKAKIIAEMYEREGSDKKNLAKYNHQVDFVELMDRVINSCSLPSRFIILHSYVQREGNDWYTPYYAKSTFYRLKKNAIHEFNVFFQKLRD